MNHLPLDTLEAAVGHQFANRALLEQALTHTSFARERIEPAPDNEQLEFLGDAVLQLVASQELFQRFPSYQEGELSKLRAHLVNANHLLHCAHLLQLGSYLRLGRGEEKTGGRRKTALLADAVEAILAALYLDGGLFVARSFVLSHILEPELDRLSSASGEVSSWPTTNPACRSCFAPAAVPSRVMRWSPKTAPPIARVSPCRWLCSIPATRPNFPPPAAAIPRNPPASRRQERRWNVCRIATMDEPCSGPLQPGQSSAGPSPGDPCTPVAPGNPPGDPAGSGGALDPAAPPVAASPAAAPKLRITPRNLLAHLQFFLLALTIALFIITFVVQAFRIPSGSMENTLLVGDYLLVDKTRFGPAGAWQPMLPYRPIHRGDIIVFRYPADPSQHFVKRVIGLPGDRIRLWHSRVYINGHAPRRALHRLQRAFSR